MQMILCACLATWLAFAIVNVGIGLIQIVFRVTLTLLAFSLYVVVGIGEIVASLWRTAFFKL